MTILIVVTRKYQIAYTNVHHGYSTYVLCERQETLQIVINQILWHTFLQEIKASFLRIGYAHSTNK